MFAGGQPSVFDVLDGADRVLGQVSLVYETSGYDVVSLYGDSESRRVGTDPASLMWLRHPDALARVYETRQGQGESLERVALRVWNRVL